MPILRRTDRILCLEEAGTCWMPADCWILSAAGNMSNLSNGDCYDSQRRPIPPNISDGMEFIRDFGHCSCYDSFILRPFRDQLCSIRKDGLTSPVKNTVSTREAEIRAKWNPCGYTGCSSRGPSSSTWALESIFDTGVASSTLSVKTISSVIVAMAHRCTHTPHSRDEN